MYYITVKFTKINMSDIFVYISNVHSSCQTYILYYLALPAEVLVKFDACVISVLYFVYL